jgi:uncharacterized protein (TIGR03067 family)
MKLSLSVFALLWATSLFAAGPNSVKQVNDERLIQGHWIVVSLRQDGKELPKKTFANIRFVITEKRISFGKISQKPMSIHYTLDSTEAPAEIDTTHQLARGTPIIQPGIYSLECETLTLSLASAGMARPKRFNEKAATTFILRRVKAPEKKP